MLVLHKFLTYSHEGVVVVANTHIYLLDLVNVVLDFNLVARRKIRIVLQFAKHLVDFARGCCVACRILHRIVKRFHFLHVQHQLERVRAVISVLATHDVRRNTAHVIKLRVPGRIEKHFGVHFKCRFGNRANVVVQNTRAENRDEIFVGRHAVTKQTCVVVVDVDAAAEFHHFRQFVVNDLSGRFDAKHVKDFANVVAKGTRGINVVERKRLQQIGTRGIEHPHVFFHVFAVVFRQHVLQLSGSDVRNDGHFFC